MRTLLLALALSTPAWAACAGSPCGLIIPTGGATASVSTANNMLGSTDMRLEGRLYGQDWASGSSWGDFLQVGNFKLSYLAGPVGALYWALPATSTATGLVCTLTGQTDVKFRIMMNATDDVASIEVYTTEDNVQVCSWSGSITAYQSSGTISAAGISVGGDADVTGSLGFLRWYSSTVPIGTVIPVAVASAAPLGDWEFNSQTLADTSGVSPNQDMSGTVTYSDEPKFSPSCSVTAGQVKQSGSTFTLDGSNSLPLNGSTTLTYSWAVVTGADSVSRAGVTFSGGTTATPTSSAVTGFGSFNGELTVTDSDMDSTTCISHNGIVSYDGNGNIDQTFSGLTALQQTFTGPLTALGHNPWTFADEAQLVSAERQTYNLTTDGGYYPYWRNYLAGTISFTGGSTTVTGSGTTLQTDLCGGDSTPEYQLVWKYTGTDGISTHYGYTTIASCTSETVIVLSSAYPSSPDAPWPTAAALGSVQYSRQAADGVGWSQNWVAPSAPANYYDNMLSFLTLYWRSGIDTYYTLYQDLFQYWNEFPMIDYFYACDNPANIIPGVCVQVGGDISRAWSVTAPAIIAMDGNHDYMLPGLRKLWQYSMDRVASLAMNNLGYTEDIRRDTYYISAIALCAAMDTGMGGLASDCQTSLITDGLEWATESKTVLDTYNYWEGFFGGGQLVAANWTSLGSGGTITCTGTSCVGTGTAFNTACNSGNCNLAIGTTNFGTQPTDNSGFEAELWWIDAVDTGTQTLTLDHAVTGTLSTRGFYAADLSGLNAYAAPPYGHALASQAFAMAAMALTGVDAMAAAEWWGYAEDALDYVINKGMVPTTTGGTGGLYNSMMFPGTTSATVTSGTSPEWQVRAALANDSQQESRVLALEAGRACSWVYLHNLSATVKTACDTIHGQLWASDAGEVGYDGFWLTALGEDGFYANDTLRTAATSFATADGMLAKWSGQQCGYSGACSSWSAARFGAATDYTTPRISGAVRFSGAVRIQ